MPSVPGEIAFEPASVPDPPRGSSTLRVVPGGDGLVAIGFDGDFGSILWTSADGRSWTDATPDDFARYGLADMVVTDGGLVGVGRGETIDIEVERAAAYLSEDGLSWRASQGGPDMSGQMVGAVATGAGIFAVGGVPGADSAGVWRSTDGGETWERAGEDLEHAFLWSIAEGGPGLVAVGWRRNPEPDLAVWTSSDEGQTWDLAPDPEGFEGFEAYDVLATPSGSLVMVGSHLTGAEGRAWTSPDGVTWSVAEVAGGMAEATMRSLIATPHGIVGVGYVGMSGAAWISTDEGRTWAPLGEPVADATFTSAYLAEDGTLIVTGGTQTGTLETGIDARAAVWTVSLGD